MPVLSNPRYERFAQGVAKGKSQHEAYVYAGYPKQQDPVNLRSSASTVARRPEVAARIQELQDKQAKRIGVTVDQLLEELQLFANLARQIKQPSAGVGAVLAKAKLLGLITDKVEIGANVRKPAKAPTDAKQMTLAEWHEKFSPRPPDQPLQ